MQFRGNTDGVAAFRDDIHDRSVTTNLAGVFAVFVLTIIVICGILRVGASVVGWAWTLSS